MRSKCSSLSSWHADQLRSANALSLVKRQRCQKLLSSCPSQWILGFKIAAFCQNSALLVFQIAKPIFSPPHLGHKNNWSFYRSCSLIYEIFYLPGIFCIGWESIWNEWWQQLYLGVSSLSWILINTSNWKRKNNNQMQVI